ncbi:MAG: VWA domain-containing protein [Pseudomonadota bacterium]
MMNVLEYFHFLRPEWLIAIPVILFFWYRIRPHKAGSGNPSEGIAPHLAKALEVGRWENRQLYPIDVVSLCGIGLAVAVAGPAWDRIPNPLVAETAPLVVVLKVTDSMENPDVQPSRLSRAVFKIEDLIRERAGARTALIAYAGTAHQVAPLTEDPNILRPLLEGLSPDIMPEEGDDAVAGLELADAILAKSETPGAVLFVLDDMAPANITSFDRPAGSELSPVIFYTVLPETEKIAQLSQIGSTTIVGLTADNADIGQIMRSLRSIQQRALAEDENLAWRDRGWWLVWPIALLAAFWFRRGWTMRWTVFVLASLVFLQPSSSRAAGLIDWFLTPDQQGRWAYENKEFAKAGDLFVDPMWKGYAKYRAGQYEEAAQILSHIDTAEAAFTQGMAEIRNRQYRPAVRSFERALELDPDMQAAATNRDIAMAIVEYVERTREQSDTGEDRGIGADDVVFDNEAGRGAETQMEVSEEEMTTPQTADQWLQSIDTDMGDFLKSRFLLDNQQGG